MDVEDFELTATNTTTLYPTQFNFYDKLTIKEFKPYLFLVGFVTSFLLLLLFFSSKEQHIYIYRAIITFAFLVITLSLPTVIKLIKLSSRGTPFTSMGIDFSRSEVIFKNNIKQLYSYSPEKIQSLEITELSRDASLWSINSKNHFKVPHSLHMPHLLGKTEHIIGLRDNKFVIKLIAHLLLLQKDIKVYGPHWKIKNLIDPSTTLQESDPEVDSIYYSNEASGSHLYKTLTVISFAIMAISLYFKDAYIAIISLIFSAYYAYILMNTPGFLKKTTSETKETPILPSLLQAVKTLNPTTAHMLTLPYNIVYPQSKNTTKKVERIMILTKNDSLMIYTSSGKNILE